MILRAKLEPIIVVELIAALSLDRMLAAFKQISEASIDSLSQFDSAACVLQKSFQILTCVISVNSGLCSSDLLFELFVEGLAAFHHLDALNLDETATDAIFEVMTDAIVALNTATPQWANKVLCSVFAAHAFGNFSIRLVLKLARHEHPQARALIPAIFDQHSAVCIYFCPE